jgi:hypothetical protein
MLAYIDQEIVDESTKYIFNNFPSVQKIIVESCYNNLNINKSVLFRRSEDFIIELPLSIESYYMELGKSTRSHMRKSKNRLQKDYPTANFVTKIGSEIEERVIDKIVRLNFDRAVYKKRMPHNNHTNISNIYKYSQHYGCVSYIEINGLIIAGCISFISNKGITAFIIGHDTDFSRYNTGQLTMVHLIKNSIEKGLSSMHLLWGELEYKTRFLGKPHPSLSYIIFRNYSIAYFVGKSKELIFNILESFRLSKYSLPLRNALKRIRRKSVKQLSKMEY